MRLSVERLERRDLMAADVLRDSLPGAGSDVTAEVIEGTLYLRGGAGHDWVQIFDGGHGQVVVQSGRLFGDGKSGFAFPILGIVDDGTQFYSAITAIVIELEAGHDYVSLWGRSLPRVHVDTGAGDDTIRLGGPSSTSWQHDVITGAIPFPVAATINRDLTIEMGDGDDSLFPHAIVKGNAVIRLGRGDDQVVETTEGLEGPIPTGLTVARGKVLDYGPDEHNGPDEEDDPDQPLVEATPVYTVVPAPTESGLGPEESLAAAAVYGPAAAPQIDDAQRVDIGLAEFLLLWELPSSRRRERTV